LGLSEPLIPVWLALKVLKSLALTGAFQETVRKIKIIKQLKETTLPIITPPLAFSNS
jgi:hypothetical protein